MRWDQANKAVVEAGILALLFAAPPFFADGRITGAEAVMLLGFFLGGMRLYMKDHPPKDDGDYVTPPGTKG